MTIFDIHSHSHVILAICIFVNIHSRVMLEYAYFRNMHSHPVTVLKESFARTGPVEAILG